MIFNAATNPIGALTGLTHGRVCEDCRRCGALVSGLVDEGKAVAAAQGIELDADPEDLIDHAARPDVAYDHKASMLQDVRRERATEIDYLNGGIVRFGEQHGVPTPLNRAIWALVKGLEQVECRPQRHGRSSGRYGPRVADAAIVREARAWTRSSRPSRATSTRASRAPSRTCPAS